MLIRGIVVGLSLVSLVWLGACDSGQKTETSQSEPATMNEPAPPGETPMESPAEPAMEPGSASSEPIALLASGEGQGVGENNEGVNHYEQGHWDVAQEHFQKALAANAGLAEAHYNLALTLDKLGNHGEATKHFKMALDNAPDNPSIRDSGILQAHIGG